MGTSTDGQICYGILFEDEYEFPWDAEQWDDGIEDWWLYEVCGYENPFELFNAEGMYIDGVEPSKEKMREYLDRKYAFQKKHPLPVELVNYCSGEFPMYILAMPGSCITANRGYPKNFDPSGLAGSTGGPLKDFCQRHGIEFKGEPQWWLSSYWG